MARTASAARRPALAARSSSKEMTGIALDLLKRAAGADPPTIEWIRERYGVTQRQAFRYLQHAKEAGVDLVPDRLADGRTVYRLSSSAYFRPEQLSVSEAIATATLTQALLGQPLQPDAATARSGVDKIRRALDQRVAERVRHLQERLSVRMIQAERPAQPKVFHTLVDAILGDRTVTVEYSSPYVKTPGERSAAAAGAARTAAARASKAGVKAVAAAAGAKASPAAAGTPARRIETIELDPFALVFARRSWYLVARKHGTDEVRTYKLARFTHCTATSTRFAMPRDFSVDAHLGDAWELMRGPGRKALAVELVFDAEFAGAIADTRWHRSQRLTPLPDGRLRFQARVAGTEEILWWVLGMGSHVHVVGPPELVEAVREETARMARVHGAAGRRG